MLRTLLADAYRLLTFRRISPAIHVNWKAYRVAINRAWRATRQPAWLPETER